MNSDHRFYPNKLLSYSLFASLLLILIPGCKNNLPIDRFSLVTRHNIEISEIDSLNSLSVGNGEFAFTTDITGLQTFPDFYSRGISLGTMSNWGWHTGENQGNDPVFVDYVRVWQK